MTCGIYCITNNINGMKYVGQSVDINKRFMQHIHSDSNSKIHRAIEKYGVNNFRFEVLLECLPSELDEQEVKFIRIIDSYNNGYNQTKGGQHHVFDAEKEFAIYSDLQEKLKEKNKMLKSLTLENKELENEVNSLKVQNRQLTVRNQKLESELAKTIDVGIPKTNIFYDLLLEKALNSVELVE